MIYTKRLLLFLLTFVCGIMFFDISCLVMAAQNQSRLRLRIEKKKPDDNPDKKKDDGNADGNKKGDKFDWNTLDKKDKTDKNTPGEILKTTKTLRDIKLPDKLKIRKYINGYEDKTFRTERAITRAEVAQAVYKLLNNGEEINYDVLKKFNDVDKEKWYSKAISYLADKQIVNGDDEKKYNPDKPITRAEVAQVLFNILKDNDIGEKIYAYGSNVYDFKDINGWYIETIKQLASNKMIDGYDDKTFKPNQNIKRSEFVVMIAKVFDRKIDEQAIYRFYDVPKDHWAIKFINDATEDI